MPTKRKSKTQVRVGENPVDAGDKSDDPAVGQDREATPEEDARHQSLIGSEPVAVDTDEGKMAEMRRLMKTENFSFAEAAAVVADQEREAAEDAPEPKPDPRVTFEVHLQPRHAEWLTRMAKFEGAIRREKDLTPSRMLEILVREAFAADPTKAGTVGGITSGPRGEFNPKSGQWDA